MSGQGSIAWRLEDLTWEEIRDRARAGAIAVVPTGSMEQHGAHLPVRVDTTLVSAVVRAAAERAADRVQVVLAPPLWLGLSTHHSAFFSLTVSFDTYQQVITELAESFIRAGFERILIVNGHGGNSDALRVTVSRIRDRHRVLVAMTDYWSVAQQAIDQIRESGRGGTGHACEFETSCMMYLDPHAVRTDRVRAEYPPQLAEWASFDLTDGGPVKVGVRFEDITQSGVVGDPTLATPEKGRLFVDAVVERLAQLLGAVATWDIRDRLHARAPGES
jgi:creatinine amidohydrolase